MRRFLIILAISCMLAGNAHAIGSGVGPVQITGLSDLNLGPWGIGDPPLSAHMDLCIYALVTLPLTSYVITVSSPSGYVLSNGLRQIPYSLYWDDSGAGNLGSGSGTQLSNGVALAGQMNANMLAPDCSLGNAGPNARLTLKITATDMTNALAGTYTGTITLLLSPN